MKNKVKPPHTDPSTYTINNSLKSLSNDPFIVQQSEKIRDLLNKGKALTLQNV